MKSLKIGVAALAAALFGYGVGPEVASATEYQRGSYADCQPENDGNWHQTSRNIGLRSGGDHKYRCSVPDFGGGATSFRREDVTAINVHVYDASNTDNVEAWACVQYWHTAGGNCGTVSATSNSGDYLVDATLTPDLTVFNSSSGNFANGFGYIEVGLCNGCDLRGYYMAKP